MRQRKWRHVVGLLAVALAVGFLLPHGVRANPHRSSGENGSDRLYLPLVMRGLPPDIPETTKVLTEETTQHLDSVSPDGLIYTFSQNTPELGELQPGDVMVADTSANAPYGFLREVTGVSESGSQVIVETAPATLEDAIRQGTISFSKQLTADDIQTVEAPSGVTMGNQGAATLPESLFFEFNDVVLYDDDGDFDTTDDQIVTNGSLDLAPSIDFDLTIQDGEVQDLVFVLNSEETAELEFETEVEVLSLDLSYEIARLHLGTITVFVGPVPVVFVIEMPVYLRGEGDVSVGIVTRVTQQADLSAGLSYERGAWTPIASLSNDFIWEPPTLSAGADFKGYVDPPVQLLVYGVAGPFGAANPYLDLEADVFADPSWELYGGLDATVGVKVEVLGRSLGDHTEVVLGNRVLLAQAGSGSGETRRVSLAPDGAEANHDSAWPAISSNGRYIAFYSGATNLVVGGTNGLLHAFVHDSQTGETNLVSVSSDGTQANDHSVPFGPPEISPDGRFVVFESEASNLAPGDTNDATDVFFHDLQTGQTSRISVSSEGIEADEYSSHPTISADGGLVAFQSFASNLVPDDTNETADVFVRDVPTGQTIRVSVASDGTGGNDFSGAPTISADGRYVAFASSSTNLVSGDTNGTGDIFVRDLQSGETRRVSVASDGSEGNGHAYFPDLSAEGRYVAFESSSSNLVVGDTNGETDVFVHDIQTGQTNRVSLASDGTQGNAQSYIPSISDGGRYVTFQSVASNLVSGDVNGWIDIFVHDRETGKTVLASVASDGSQANAHSWYPEVADNGPSIAFQSDASNLVAEDTNSRSDIFVRSWGIDALFLTLAE